MPLLKPLIFRLRPLPSQQVENNFRLLTSTMKMMPGNKPPKKKMTCPPIPPHSLPAILFSHHAGFPQCPSPIGYLPHLDHRRALKGLAFRAFVPCATSLPACGDQLPFSKAHRAAPDPQNAWSSTCLTHSKGSRVVHLWPQ